MAEVDGLRAPVIVMRVPTVVTRVMARGADAELVTVKDDNAAADRLGAKRMLHVFDETERRVRVALHKRQRQQAPTLGAHSDEAYLDVMARARELLSSDEVLSVILDPQDADVWPSISDLQRIVHLRAAATNAPRGLADALMTLHDDWVASGVYPLTETVQASSGATEAQSGAASRTRAYAMRQFESPGELGDVATGTTEDAQLSTAAQVFAASNAYTADGDGAQQRVTALVHPAPVTAVVVADALRHNLVDRHGLRLRQIHIDRLLAIGGGVWTPSGPQPGAAPPVVLLADLCDWTHGWAMTPRAAASFVVRAGPAARVRASHGVCLTVCPLPKTTWHLTVVSKMAMSSVDASARPWWAPARPWSTTQSKLDVLIAPTRQVALAFERQFRERLSDALAEGRARWQEHQHGPWGNRRPTGPPLIFYDDGDIEVLATPLDLVDAAEKVVVFHGCRTAHGLPVSPALERDLANGVPSLAALELALTAPPPPSQPSVTVNRIHSAAVTTSISTAGPLTAATVNAKLRALFAENGGILTKAKIDADPELQRATAADRDRALKALASFSRKDGGWKLDH